MPKSRMAPEQEAMYAFSYGGRDDLSPEAQEIYNRLVAIGTAGLPGPSSVIESIENLGWRLDMMSWVPRRVSAFRAEGIFLFRRE